MREIDEARLEPARKNASTNAARYLDNVERIASALHAARDALAGDDGGATGALGAASAALAGVAKFDERLRDMSARASALQADAGDLAADVAGALDAAEYDPAELEAINARLELLERLKRKYGGTLDGVLGCGAPARELVDEYENRDRRVAELTRRRRRLRAS